MPELPEVETIKNQLKKHLVGKKIISVKILDKKIYQTVTQTGIENLYGKKVIDIYRRGKVLIVELKNNHYLAFHLKMTGKLILKKQDQQLKVLSNKHSRAIINFSSNLKLIFSDLRRFGWFKIFTGKIKEDQLIKQKLGPEPFSKDFSFSYLKSELKKSKRPIKLFLLDQSKIAGIGNIYASEALYLAKISPKRISNTLLGKEIVKLRKAILQVLQKGITLGGASDNDYLNAYEEEGEYQKHFLVYGQEGEQCLKCKSKIVRLKQGGRSSFYCELCQK
jgi:formamidopyrimidine-DNA glycosylase